MKRNLTCIICPKGCLLEAELTEGNVAVTGNDCPRGEAYAKSECTNPKRTVTTTIKCTDGSVVAVKTLEPIPKDKIFECVEIVNKAIIDLPISIGDVIMKDVFGTNIVVTGNPTK